MSAKEMFKELGYIKFEFESEIVYKFIYKDICIIRVSFDKFIRTYSINKRNQTVSVGIELHKAITKQMKELGWIE